MQGRFTTRAFVASDYSEAAALWAASEGIELAEGDSRAEVAAYVKRNRGLSRVAVAKGKIIGAVLCGHDGRRGLIYHLAVASTYRRAGVGKKLLGECLDGLQRKGVKRALLLVGKGNAKGQKFWLSQGFEHIPGAIPLGKDLVR